MVDKDLLKEIKEKMDAGASASDVNDILSVCKLFKQIFDESEESYDEPENIDMSFQMVVTDENKKFWVDIYNEIEFGEGRIDNPLFVLYATKEVCVGILFGQVDVASAYIKTITV